MVGNLTDKVLTENTYINYINKCSSKIHVVLCDFVYSINIEVGGGGSEQS